MPKGHRMSSLPLAQFCSQSPRLSQVGAGRAAATSTAGHARFGNDPRAADLYTRLTPEEQSEVDSWIKPASIVLDAENGVVFEYDKSMREVEVGLNADGEHCPAASPDCISVGHLDCGAVFEYGGHRVALVVDLKRSEYTSEVTSRQLEAYLLAWASLNNCDMGCIGIWNLTDAEWLWGDMVDLGVFSEEADAMRRRVVSAAMNQEPGYAHGAHCRGCYGREGCPVHLMPMELAETSLAPFTAPGGLAALSDVERGNLLLQVNRAEDTIKKVKAAMKAAAASGLAITDGAGKIYKRIPMKGKLGFNKDQLEKDDPVTYAKYAKMGKPSEQYRWINA